MTTTPSGLMGCLPACTTTTAQHGNLVSAMTYHHAVGCPYAPTILDDAGNVIPTTTTYTAHTPCPDHRPEVVMVRATRCPTCGSTTIHG